jgi:thioredoxin 1
MLEKTGADIFGMFIKLKRSLLSRMYVIKVDNKQDLDTELAKTKRVLALFYASWCPYCMRFVPFFNKKVLGQEFGSVIHVLLDDYDNPLWDDYGVSAVPTAILFEDGKVCNRLDGRLGGGLKEEQFVTWLQDLR